MALRPVTAMVGSATGRGTTAHGALSDGGGRARRAGPMGCWGLAAGVAAVGQKLAQLIR